MNFLTKYFKAQIEKLGASILDVVGGLGRFSNFAFLCMYWMFKRPFRTKLGWEQFYFIGNKSIFIVALTAAFSGMVMTYQTYLGFTLISADGFLGPIVALALAKELGPVFTGLIIAGRCGAAMAAQIGTMKVTEQVDALEVMGISSHQYLAVPRILATTFMMPILSTIFLLVGSVGSYVVGTKVLQIDGDLYFSQLGVFMFISDIFQGLIKATVFGYLIAVIGTYQGFSVKGGADGVGKATNLAVVWGMVMVLIVDYFLTSFLVLIL